MQRRMTLNNMKYSFFNDYSEGAHPRILEVLVKTNMSQESGYGYDSFCDEAARLIRERTEAPTADVHFVTGGTQANLIAFAAMLRPYESVIAATTGHIAVHEAGAIEATGHKVHTIPTSDGKLTTADIQCVVDEHADEHMVKPRAVFVSQATELGTVYSKQELQAVSEVCKKNRLYLYVDGARLGSALASDKSDLSLAELANLADMFYIGGTKNGALFGEAIVINNPELKDFFRYHLKQRGALLAKGRVLGVQFAELFRDTLYVDLAQHANRMAKKLADGIAAQNYSFLCESFTNQIFPILPLATIERLESNYGFYVWKKVDDNHSAIRLVTSWATPETAVENFLLHLSQLNK